MVSPPPDSARPNPMRSPVPILSCSATLPHDGGTTMMLYMESSPSPDSPRGQPSPVQRGAAYGEEVRGTQAFRRRGGSAGRGRADDGTAAPGPSAEGPGAAAVADPVGDQQGRSDQIGSQDAVPAW
ncbi:hypothetical protein GCM10010095_50590 [Streptomyces anthocyanicus]|uniref:Uncharacterized protein n=1 Tax=Streptomyces violaceolatus TaxID=67378 RepID=A0ABN3TI55_9ACTN|nr:hypothetical protein SLITK23_46830 [Streptomyces lividans]GGL59374.1 hypothetical protein GCM10010095_50590 [Streptomyces anthocyanicus]